MHTNISNLLSWKLPDARAEIARILIRQVTKEGVVDAASIAAGEVSWTDLSSREVLAYEIRTQEYSGLLSEPIRCSAPSSSDSRSESSP